MNHEIKKYITELYHTIMMAGLNHEVWWTYKEKDSRKKYVDTMNHYTMFFQTSIHAHFVAMLIALYRLYENRTDTVNIPELVNLLEKNASIPKAALHEIRQLCQESRNLWKKVSILRNAVFAHRSKKSSIFEVFQKTGVTNKELKDLITATKTLINKISYEYDHSSFAFNLDGRASEDINRLLDDLKRLRENSSNMNVAPTL
jgi:AbiU2